MTWKRKNVHLNNINGAKNYTQNDETKHDDAHHNETQPYSAYGCSAE